MKLWFSVAEYFRMTIRETANCVLTLHNARYFKRHAKASAAAADAMCCSEATSMAKPKASNLYCTPSDDTNA